MSNASHDPTTVRLVAAVVAVVAVGALAMGVVMALAMSDMMSGGHMRGGNRAPQTPVVLEQQEVAVEITNFDYSPRDVSVKAGTKVTWTNRDAVPHTATDTEDGWDTGILNEGDSGSITLEQPGTYEYYCTLHPYMKGSVTVR